MTIEFAPLTPLPLPPREVQWPRSLVYKTPEIASKVWRSQITIWAAAADESVEHGEMPPKPSVRYRPVADNTVVRSGRNGNARKRT
jgi:hypothetical protein